MVQLVRLPVRHHGGDHVRPQGVVVTVERHLLKTITRHGYNNSDEDKTPFFSPFLICRKIYDYNIIYNYIRSAYFVNTAVPRLKNFFVIFL